MVLRTFTRPRPDTLAGVHAPTLFGLDYKWTVFICTVFGVFMIFLDSTIVNIALPKITAVFGVSVNDAQLVITCYLLAAAVVMPAAGYLGDTLGTKHLFLLNIGLFTGGSVLCALAWNNPSLVVFRVIQGLGGGMMMPLGVTMLYKVVPPAERNAIMGLYALPVVVAPVLGPTIGGYLVEYVNWQSIFTLNVPFGIVGATLGWIFLRESDRTPGLRFDFRGFVLSAIGFSALLLGLTDAPSAGWTAPHILLRFAIGLTAFAGWVWVELTDEQPLLELRLFKDPTFSLAMLVNFVLTVGLFGGQLLVPFFLQTYRGLGAAETGRITMFAALPMLVLMPLVGRAVDRVGLRLLFLLGMPLVAVTTLALASLDLNLSDNSLRLLLVLRGAAMGLVIMPAMTAALNAAPMHLMSRASSLTNVARQLFGSFGVAIFVTILSNRATYHAAMLGQTVTPDNFTLQQILTNTQQLLTQQGASAAQIQAIAMTTLQRYLGLTAMTMAVDDVFRVAALITLLAVIPAAFLRSPKRAGGAPAPTPIAE
jgi:EmrB/QacA subfamily drug resistance transporter